MNFMIGEVKMDLNDKVALVTGGGRGIGKAIVEHLAERGASLAIVDIDEEAANSLAGKLCETGHKAIGIKADVTGLKDAEEAVSITIKNFGKLDILINNAGVTRDNLLIRMSEEDWNLVLDINLKGVFNFTKAAARHMMRQRTGAIVNISSVVGISGNPGQANYSASKAGVIGLTKTTARELSSRGIRVNAIAPGFIKTIMTDKLSDNVKEGLISRIPLACLGEPNDVAEAVSFLVSDGAKYVTGQVLNVDGGMIM